MTSSDASDSNSGFEELLDYLRQKHHFDFSGYKYSSLMRRIQYRMHQVEIKDYCHYQEYLAQHPEEYPLLFETIEINLTAFFRDRGDWEFIQQHIIPQIEAEKPPNEAIRVWSAGCASGEEAYTVAIVLAELLGIQQFQQRVRIYGTDIDADAIEQSRRACYSEQKLTNVAIDLRDRYFEPFRDGYRVRRELRESITFHRHNLIKDAPFSNIDLLICRNTLIYFGLEAQLKVLVRFHFGLKQSGFLFLGRAETVTQQPDLFMTVNPSHRVFTKIPRGHLNARLLIDAFRPAFKKTSKKLK